MASIEDKLKTLAYRVLLCRRDLNWDQEVLAERSGISRGYISKIERAYTTNVGIEVVFALANALGVSAAYLLSLTDDPLGGLPNYEDSEETKTPTPTVGAELLTLYQQLSPQQQDTLLNIAKVLKAADEPRIVGGEA